MKQPLEYLNWDGWVVCASILVVDKSLRLVAYILACDPSQFTPTEINFKA